MVSGDRSRLAVIDTTSGVVRSGLVCIAALC
jgi:hypothetical protein